ncbi:MAG: cytochrome c4, partial [Gammaproteobacteria bacterium]|nr:cytochrome c4 [Gammaproteobacteria bacterium]
DIAAYFSQLKAPSSAPSSVSQMAETLVHRGDPRRILPPCAACHERDGRGQKIDVPAIRGQSSAYLEKTLKDYKSGQRHNDLFGRMRALSQELSDKEIKALAEYYGQ